MKKESKLQWTRRFLAVVLTLCMAMMIGISADVFSIVSRAEGQGRITVDSARIRSEASTSSAMVGSAKKNDTVTIIGQVQGADGFTWYEVQVSATVKGFIRSDLLELVDGNAPATAPSEAPVEVIDVNPVTATVTSGTSVRVRENASANSKIVATVVQDFALTVTGKADGADGYTWYRVSFISNGSQISGFIRSNYVTLASELTPAVQAPPEVTQEPEVTQPPEQPPENVTQPAEPSVKEYDTILIGDDWWLYQPSNNDSYLIKELLDGNRQTLKNQKTVIIVLVILLVAALATVGYLVFKIKDVMDSAYFNQVESETLRKRSAAAAQGSSQRVMHTVGSEKPPVKSAGTQGQRPAGTQGQRPAGTQGQRPAGTQGQRPAGTQGQRPAGTQGQRPSGQGQPVQSGAPKPQPKDNQQAQGWQSKNFMTDDDDEFEFEFLNVDDNEKK